MSVQGSRYSISVSLTLLFLLVIPFANVLSEQKNANVDAEHQRFFVHYVDNRSLLEKVLNSFGLTNSDVGRSFALIAGVSFYPHLGLDKELKPAKQDLIKMERYLRDCEFFDEIVLLENEDMNYDNLEYFLQTYFPDRLKDFPKSRFLFVYSGHGYSDGRDSYLLKYAATGLSDKKHSIKITTLRDLVDEVVKSASKENNDDIILDDNVLVLLNACYGGAFLERPFGDEARIPKYGGAHAITAGGSREKTWHIRKVGTGSVFFETILRGLNGHADKYPSDGDGLVTAYELITYLKEEARRIRNQRQTPQIGDISISANGSRGQFFFFSRQCQIDKEVIPRLPEWDYLDEPMGPATVIIGDDGARMVLIPEGEFRMGSQNGDDDEDTIHTIYLDAFYMDVHEVTNAQYRKFMEATGHEAPALWNDPDFNASDQPVVAVRWDDAVAYCQWAGKRLPTEAEWEKAARGGLVGMNYPWGTDNPQDKANFGNKWGRPISVKSFRPNGYGLYDMAGNVWEWCADWYDRNYYAQSPNSNPAGPDSGTTRVIRGGSAGTTVEFLRCANRNSREPSDSAEYIGFRCVRGMQ